MEDVVATNPLARDLDDVLEQVGPLWQDLRAARVFITGGTGFFGCWLLETLLWANDRLGLAAEVVVLTRDPAAFEKSVPHLASHQAVTLHAGDVTAFQFPEGAVTHVIHAAVDATPPANQADRRRVVNVTIDGTRRALEFARAAGVRRFLFTSSGAVYGRQPGVLPHVPEEYEGGPDPTDLARAGAEAKRTAEMLCAVHADEGFDVTIARCFAFIGPYQPLDGKFASANFVRDALAGGPIVVSGDGTPYRSYLYGSDLAAWLWTILLRGRPGVPYNVGSEDAISVADLARRIASTPTPATDVRIDGAAKRGDGGDYYVPSTLRARQELGVTMRVGLDEAIERTMEWYAAR